MDISPGKSVSLSPRALRMVSKETSTTLTEEDVEKLMTERDDHDMCRHSRQKQG